MRNESKTLPSGWRRVISRVTFSPEAVWESVLPVRRKLRLAYLEDRLCFQERELIRVGMERMNVEFVIARVEIDKAERREVINRPLVECNIQPPVLGVVDIVAMRRREQLGRHSFDLS